MIDRVVCLSCQGERYQLDGVSRCLHCDADGLVSQKYAGEMRKRGFGEPSEKGAEK